MTRLPRIVIVDSGVDRHHPGVRGRGVVIAGPAFRDDGSSEPEGGGVDRIGHGTAVAAAILHQCGSADLIAVRVFDESASCAFDRVLHALRWAIDQGPDLVNVSLGTASPAFAAPLRAIVAGAVRGGIRIVAPAAREGLAVLPGMLEGVDAVVADANVPELLPVRREVGGRAYWFASPVGDWRRPAVEGASLATAHVTGWLARAHPGTR